MRLKSVWLSVILMISLALAMGVLAQEATPEATADMTSEATAEATSDAGAEMTPEATMEATSEATDEAAAEAEIVGDANAESLQVVQEYLMTRDTSLLAEDAEFYGFVYGGTTGTMSADMLNPSGAPAEPVRGRDDIGFVQEEFYEVAFVNSEVTPVRYIVAGDVVVAEFEFFGTNNGSFANAPASGRDVTLPMVGIFDVAAGQITRIRMYYDSNMLQYQLGYVPYGGAGLAPGTDPLTVISPYSETMRAVFDDPEAHYGQEVTIDGLVGQALGDRAFILRETGALGNDELIVVDATEDGLGFIQIADALVRLEGTIQAYNADEMRAQMGEGFEESAFADYAERPVLYATAARNLDDAQQISAINENPEAFYGQQVSIDGSVGEAIGDRAFILNDAAEQLIVVSESQEGFDFAQVPDAVVRVTGVVQETGTAGLADLLSEDYNAEAIAAYEGLPVMLASSIVNISDAETVGNVLDYPESFIGLAVTVEGLVDEVLSDRAFYLREDAVLGIGARRVLVLAPDAQMFEPDSRLRVTGTVQTFNGADMTGEYSIDPAAPGVAEYEGQGVIIAEEFTPVEGVE